MTEIGVHGYQAAEFEQMRCNNKIRFILAVVADKLKISNRKRCDIEEQLMNQGYDKMPNKGAMVSAASQCCVFELQGEVAGQQITGIAHCAYTCLQHRVGHTASGAMHAGLHKGDITPKRTAC